MKAFVWYMTNFIISGRVDAEVPPLHVVSTEKNTCVGVTSTLVIGSIATWLCRHIYGLWRCKLFWVKPYFKIQILTVTGCCGWLNLDIYLHNQKGLLSNMSQQPCAHKRTFWESFFFLYELELILTESDIQWWPFISIGSSSFSSITCAARAISC